MRRIILVTTLLMMIAFSGFAQNSAKTKEATKKSVAIQNQKSSHTVIREYVDQIKAEEIPARKLKIVSDLIDLVNKETSKYSNIVTENISKILDAEKNPEGTVAPLLINEKDQNQAIYDSWLVYRIALKANYDLFIEKNDKYSCSSFSEQIWKDYTPIAPQQEKVEVDADTKKAIETSVEIAEELCKHSIDLL